MQTVDNVYFSTLALHHLSHVVEKHKNNGIFIIVDENTRRLCLPILMEYESELQHAEVIEIASGELTKSIQTASQIWNILAEKHANRNSLVICLGGGMITDLGGFVAATFMRGISFIHIPTTLLGMVDASLGGKTAVNMGVIKNQIGVFALPQSILIFPEFLNTLSLRQKQSGYAEMIKTALIHSPALFYKIADIKNMEDACNEDIIAAIAHVKLAIVQNDFLETGLRKVLNLGHTIGHAIEAYAQTTENPLLHGEAIAVGLLCEAYISNNILNFPDEDFSMLETLIRSKFTWYELPSGDIKKVMSFMRHDKKNTMYDNRYNCTLLKALGEPVIDQMIDEDMVRESLIYYNRSNS